MRTKVHTTTTTEARWLVMAEGSNGRRAVKPKGLVAAARDPRLLGASITWRESQLALLARLSRSQMMHLWRVGRQSGKTSLAAAAAVHNCTMRADLDDMIPHSRWRAVPVVSP